MTTNTPAGDQPAQTITITLTDIERKALINALWVASRESEALMLFEEASNLPEDSIDSMMMRLVPEIAHEGEADEFVADLASLARFKETYPD